MISNSSDTDIKAEVVVVGGGPTGIVAAVAAARNGANCLLVERYGFLGGTALIICGWAGFQDRDGNQIIGGIGNEIIERLVDLGGSSGHIPKPVSESTTQIHPDLFKYVAVKMCVEADVKLLLHSFYTESSVDRRRINSIEIQNKSGKQNIYGDLFIDCTGDADVAAASGCAFEKGRQFDGRMQPVTTTFRMASFDRDKFVDYLKEHPEEMEKANTWTEAYNIEDFLNKDRFSGFKGLDKLVERVKNETGYELPRDRLHFNGTPMDGVVQINTSRVIDIDATSAEDLTRAEIEGIQQAVEIADFLTKHVPGFESSFLLDTSVQTGVRETRRIIGDYIINEEDILETTKFPDAVAQGIYPLDIHDVDGRGMRHNRVTIPYQIPYRALLAKDLDNLLVAGRCISSTHEALGALRVVPNCMAMGQAAGTAAALAVREGKLSPREIDIETLQKTLKQQGAIIW